jgi:peptidoglycan/xylan/chitin deacetylase (PgdA/CDA1 family)
MRAILTYHSIDTSNSVISVDPSVLRRQLEWLAQSSVRVVPLTTLTTLPDDADAVSLTFDDAYQNFADVAAPLLAEHRFPATLFVVSEHAGGSNRWRGRSDPRIPDLPLLGWRELTRLADGGVSLGAHTRTHPKLDRLDPSQLADEIIGAGERIRRETGHPVTEFAYPYGRATPLVTDVARSAYAVACTTELRVLRGDDDPLALPRIDMYYCRRTGSLERWGTSWFRYSIGLRSFARAARARLVPDASPL